MVTNLLLTAYRNLPTPYPTVPSPTPYDVPFSHSTSCYRQTDRQTDDRRTSISATVSTMGWKPYAANSRECPEASMGSISAADSVVRSSFKFSRYAPKDACFTQQSW